MTKNRVDRIAITKVIANKITSIHQFKIKEIVSFIVNCIEEKILNNEAVTVKNFGTLVIQKYNRSGERYNWVKREWSEQEPVTRLCFHPSRGFLVILKQKREQKKAKKRVDF